MKTIYTNTDAISYEIANIENAKTNINVIIGYLVENNIAPTKKNVLEVCSGQLITAVEEFAATETEKLQAFIEKMGDFDLITNDYTERNAKKVVDFGIKINANLPKIDLFTPDYMQYIDIVDGKTVTSPETESLLKEKHSIQVDEKQFKQHSDLCDLMNKVFAHPENEFDRLHELFYFNPESKEFEISLNAYDTGEINRKFVENKTLQLTKHLEAEANQRYLQNLYNR
jgi:hypothetical protein